MKAADVATETLKLFSGRSILKSPRLSKAVIQNLNRKRFQNQAQPIPVRGIKALEETLINKIEPRNLRIIAGFALWCTGTRLQISIAVRIAIVPELEPEAVRLAQTKKAF